MGKRSKNDSCVMFCALRHLLTEDHPFLLFYFCREKKRIRSLIASSNLELIDCLSVENHCTLFFSKMDEDVIASNPSSIRENIDNALATLASFGERSDKSQSRADILNNLSR